MRTPQLIQPLLVFDIETIPDLALGKRMHGLDLPDDEARLALRNLRRQALLNAGASTQTTHKDFPPLYSQEIVCISGLWVNQGELKLFSFSQKNLSEKEIIQRFLSIFEKHTPVLVSWNGSGFDLPLLNLRALKHHLSAPKLFDQGDLDDKRKYNNYQNRYHLLHTDVMDMLSMFNGKNFQRLDDVCALLGLAGKQGVFGSDMEQYVAEGRWDEIEQYCESDVLNTWLVYLRWQLLRGQLTLDSHTDWVNKTRNFVGKHAVHQHGFALDWHEASAVSMI